MKIELTHQELEQAVMGYLQSKGIVLPTVTNVRFVLHQEGLFWPRCTGVIAIMELADEHGG